jgi:hypothetical protein
MFAIYGKSLKKEFIRKSAIDHEERFNKDKGAYIVSPEFFDIQRCHEFIKLSKKQTDIRPIYVAEQKHVLDKNGNLVVNKKTKQPKMKYQKLFDIEE